MDAVVGGWALSGIFNFESGQYFTPYYLNSPTVLNSPIYDRPNLVGDPHVAHPNQNEWYNPAAYADLHSTPSEMPDATVYWARASV